MCHERSNEKQKEMPRLVLFTRVIYISTKSSLPFFVSAHLSPPSLFFLLELLILCLMGDYLIFKLDLIAKLRWNVSRRVLLWLLICIVRDAKEFGQQRDRDGANAETQPTRTKANMIPQHLATAIAGGAIQVCHLVHNMELKCVQPLGAGMPRVVLTADIPSKIQP
jgi:hypothetical protein